MNKQGNKNNPRGGIEWCHLFGPLTGYTANPVRGCKHDCKWRMPTGKIVQCYAKSVAERFPGKHYAKGFEDITFDETALEKIRSHKEPCGIFIDSMSDLFGSTVKSDWIMQVLLCIQECPQHIFFSLTKNPARLPAFSPFPNNLFLGMSMPPTFMFGHELTPEQQRAWLVKGLQSLAKCEANVRWISLEPLSFDCSEILLEHGRFLKWAVIGAGSDGATNYQPDTKTFSNTLSALTKIGAKVFYKGNISHELAESCGGRREEFPKL